MKKSFKLFGIIALVAVIGFSMTGCPALNGPDPGSDPDPGEPGVLRNVDIRGAHALMIAPRGSLEEGRSRARTGIVAFNAGDLALYMEVGEGDQREWVEVSMTDDEGTELDLGAPVDLMALTPGWVVMRWSNGDEHLVSTATGAVFDASPRRLGFSLMSSRNFPDYLPFDTDHTNPREFNLATASAGPNPVHNLFPGQSKVHTVSANRVFALVRHGNFWIIMDVNMTGDTATISPISPANQNVRQFAVDSNNNILFDVGTGFMQRMIAVGGTGTPVIAPGGTYRRGAIPTIFSVNGQIYFLIREVFEETSYADTGWTIDVDGTIFNYFNRQIRAYRVQEQNFEMAFSPITDVDGLYTASALATGLFTRTTMEPLIIPFSDEVVFDLAANAAFHSLPLNGNGYDVRFNLATNSAFQSLPLDTGGPPEQLVNLATNSAFQSLPLNHELPWGDVFAGGLRIHANNVTAVSGPGSQARALRVPTDETWGQGVYLLNEYFNFQPGDSIVVSGTVENLGPYTGQAGLIMLNAAPGVWQQIAVEYQIDSGPFTLSATLQDWHMPYIRYAGREHGDPGIRLEIRSDTATTIIHNIQVERPGTAADDIFAGIPLLPAGGHHTLVAGPSTQARAIQITTNAAWGQGVEISQAELDLRAGDRVVVTGFLETLGDNEGQYWADPLVQLNANPGEEVRVVGSAHTTEGAFTLDAVLDQDDVAAIASALARYADPSPGVHGGLGLRLELRGTGTVGRIYNIRLERPDTAVDMFANIPLAPDGGNHALVVGQTAQTRAIRVTTDQDWGQGVGIEHSAMNLQAGDMITVTGRLVTLGTEGQVFINADPARGWDQVGTTHNTVGAFSISGTLTQENVDRINDPHEYAATGLRIDFRGTGTVGVIYNVRITRGDDPGNGGGPSPGPDPDPLVRVSSPSFTGGVDRMFHFLAPNPRTVILERYPGAAWDTSDRFVISTWPATGRPTVSHGTMGGISHEDVNLALHDGDTGGQGIMIAGRTRIYLRANDRVIGIPLDGGNAVDVLTAANAMGIQTVLHHEVTGLGTVLVDGVTALGQRQLIEIIGQHSFLLRSEIPAAETITLVRLF